MSGVGFSTPRHYFVCHGLLAADLLQEFRPRTLTLTFTARRVHLRRHRDPQPPPNPRQRVLPMRSPHTSAGTECTERNLRGWLLSRSECARDLCCESRHSRPRGKLAFPPPPEPPCREEYPWPAAPVQI